MKSRYFLSINKYKQVIYILRRVQVMTLPSPEKTSRQESTSLPVFIEGIVVQGFGRGSKKLGCPTANLSPEVVNRLDHLSTGVYFGYAVIVTGGSNTSKDNHSSQNDTDVHGMVCSLGYNPHFGNTTKSLEVHILHSFQDDFYGALLRVVIIGRIRDEKKFDTIDALIQAIEEDKEYTRRSLATGDFEHLCQQIKQFSPSLAS